MHFPFALELSNLDLLNTYLLDTHLDLLDADIPSKYFACVHNVFKTSSRHLQDLSLRHLQEMSSRRFQEMSSRRFLDMSSRCLQDMSSRHLARCLQDVLEDVKLLRSRRIKDAFKTNKYFLGVL